MSLGNEQTRAGRQLVFDTKQMMKLFEKEQKDAVEAVLRDIGRTESRDMAKRLKGKGRIGQKVAAAVNFALRPEESKDKYAVLEIGALDHDVIGSRGADLAHILAFGKAKGKPVKEPPKRILANGSTNKKWFFNNAPGKGITFQFPTYKKGGKPYVSPEKEPEPAFLEKSMQNIEKKIQDRVMEGLIDGWNETATKTNRMRNRFRLG